MNGSTITEMYLYLTIISSPHRINTLLCSNDQHTHRIVKSVLEIVARPRTFLEMCFLNDRKTLMLFDPIIKRNRIT